eukprot:768425-Pleurochrysis_carterae.AAC.1
MSAHARKQLGGCGNRGMSCERRVSEHDSAYAVARAQGCELAELGYTGLNAHKHTTRADSQLSIEEPKTNPNPRGAEHYERGSMALRLGGTGKVDALAEHVPGRGRLWRRDAQSAREDPRPVAQPRA